MQYLHKRPTLWGNGLWAVFTLYVRIGDYLNAIFNGNFFSPVFDNATTGNFTTSDILSTLSPTSPSAGASTNNDDNNMTIYIRKYLYIPFYYCLKYAIICENTGAGAIVIHSYLQIRYYFIYFYWRSGHKQLFPTHPIIHTHWQAS